MSQDSNRQSHPELDESLEVAVWSVVSEPLPPGAVDRVKRKAKHTAANNETVSEDPSGIPSNDGIQFSPMLKLTLAASLLAALLAGGSYFGSPFGGTSVYAQAAKRLESIESMVCYLQFSSTSQPENLDDSHSRQRVEYLAPSYHRVVDERLKTIQIIDRERHRTVLLNTDAKEAIVLEGDAALTLDANSPARIVEALLNHVRIDRADDDSVTRIADTIVDGVSLEGYESVMGNETVRVWFDPRSSAPVIVALRFEVPGSFQEGESVKMWQVMFEIELNAALDPDQFSSDVPFGYSTLGMGNLKVDHSTPVLDDLLKMLRFCAENNDSQFPTSLSINDTPGTPLSIQQDYLDRLQTEIESGPDGKRKDAIEAAKQSGMMLGRATAFLMSIKDKNDWSYFGGASVNQQDRPLLWYSPNGNRDYVVVYADLTVHDVGMDDLPAAPIDVSSPIEKSNIIRVSTPRFRLPKTTIRDFGKLSEIRRQKQQLQVEYLQLAMMPEILESQVTFQPGDEMEMQVVDPTWKPNRDAGESRLSFLGEFKNLKGLDVSNLYLTDGDLTVIGDLRQLERLSLSGVYLFDKTASRRLTGDDLSKLSNLTALQLLDLSQSNYASGMSHLAILPNLHTIYLSSFENLNDATLAELEVLPRLESLVFAPVYGKNPKTTVTESGLNAFKRMPSLKTLYVGYHGKWTLPIERLRKMLSGVDVRSPTE